MVLAIILQQRVKKLGIKYDAEVSMMFISLLFVVPTVAVHFLYLIKRYHKLSQVT